jgi:hypothetical protein
MQLCVEPVDADCKVAGICCRRKAKEGAHRLFNDSVDELFDELRADLHILAPVSERAVGGKGCRECGAFSDAAIIVSQRMLMRISDRERTAPLALVW